MKLSKKPRHWIALLVAVPTMILALITVADWTGEPEPRWREICTGLGTTLTVALVVTNIALDSRERGPK